MADGNGGSGGSNAAVVAILVIFVIIVAAALFMRVRSYTQMRRLFPFALERRAPVTSCWPEFGQATRRIPQSCRAFPGRNGSCTGIGKSLLSANDIETAYGSNRWANSTAARQPGHSWR